MTNKTAWFMMHRIREAMKRGEMAESMSGIIVADETYIGGAPGNRHRSAQTRKAKGGHGTDKVSGEVRSRVMAQVTSATLEKAFAEQVNVADSFLYTDGAQGHRDHEPRRGVLLAAQAVARRHAPPGQRRAPAPLPGRVRLPIQHL